MCRWISFLVLDLLVPNILVEAFDPSIGFREILLD
jgi:hypothetical protein